MASTFIAEDSHNMTTAPYIPTESEVAAYTLPHDRLQNMAREIAPADLEGLPFYVADLSDLPADQRPADLLGVTSPVHDVAHKPGLGERWAGRGPAVSIAAARLYAGALQDAAGNESFACELVEGRAIAVCCHELAHVLEGPFDASLSADELFGVAVGDMMRRYAAGDVPPPRVPWQGHDGQWLRMLAHVVYRTEALIGHRLPGSWLSQHDYGLSPLHTYRRALVDEVEAMAGASFAEIRTTRPPASFVRLWRGDVTAWLQTELDGIDWGADVITALRLFE